MNGTDNLYQSNITPQFYDALQYFQMPQSSPLAGNNLPMTLKQLSKQSSIVPNQNMSYGANATADPNQGYDLSSLFNYSPSMIQQQPNQQSDQTDQQTNQSGSGY